MLSLCRVSLVSLRALAYVFPTCEPKPRASCLSDWFSQVWTWNLIGLTLATGLFLSESPFPEGSTLTGPGWSTHPLQSQCWKRGTVIDSLTKTTCTDEGASQKERGFCYQKGDGNIHWVGKTTAHCSAHHVQKALLPSCGAEWGRTTLWEGCPAWTPVPSTWGCPLEGAGGTFKAAAPVSTIFHPVSSLSLLKSCIITGEWQTFDKLQIPMRSIIHAAIWIQVS